MEDPRGCLCKRAVDLRHLQQAPVRICVYHYLEDAHGPAYTVMSRNVQHGWTQDSLWSSGPRLQGAHLDELLQLKWVQPCVQLMTTVQVVCIRTHPLNAGATPCH